MPGLRPRRPAYGRGPARSSRASSACRSRRVGPRPCNGSAERALPGAAHLVVAVRATSAKGWLCGRQSDQEVDSAEQWAFTPRWTPTAAATPSITAGTAHGHRITPTPTTGTGSRGTKLTWPAGPTSTMSRCSRQWASLQNKSASDGDTSTTGVRADHVRPGKARGLVRSRAARRRPEARVRTPGRRRCCRTIQLVSAALFEMHDEWSASPRPPKAKWGTFTVNSLLVPPALPNAPTCTAS